MEIVAEGVGNILTSRYVKGPFPSRIKERLLRYFALTEANLKD